MTTPPLDIVDRRVRSLVYDGIARAHLGYIPVNHEWDNVCDECRGDGCTACNGTGELLPALADPPVTHTRQQIRQRTTSAPDGEQEAS